jgi:hypothetical protein
LTRSRAPTTWARAGTVPAPAGSQPPDPLGLSAGAVNLYRYVLNAPSQGTDPARLNIRPPPPPPIKVRAKVGRNRSSAHRNPGCGRDVWHPNPSRKGPNERHLRRDRTIAGGRPNPRSTVISRNCIAAQGLWPKNRVFRRGLRERRSMSQYLVRLEHRPRAGSSGRPVTPPR